MTKKDIILDIHKEIPRFSYRFIQDALNLFFQEISHCLAQEGSVEFRGFGNFVCKHRSAYTGINPKTQERIFVPRKKVIVFRPGSFLKKELILRPKEKKKFGLYRNWKKFGSNKVTYFLVQYTLRYDIFLNVKLKLFSKTLNKTVFSD
ncbi:integration host factor subunit beta [Holospora obtusa F1]|uniref:Integration host factor subunit beta n=1 Tax=Holospora obtusa F1 TaxID=1399147 RepID=W6TVB1_HOLOB|nr:HU family DNA-binding protein [Holospora obtusa]ETZ07722.1 integration host factor subunit beta [Holospora obtusa F1]